MIYGFGHHSKHHLKKALLDKSNSSLEVNNVPTAKTSGACHIHHDDFEQENPLRNVPSDLNKYEKLIAAHKKTTTMIN